MKSGREAGAHRAYAAAARRKPISRAVPRGPRCGGRITDLPKKPASNRSYPPCVPRRTRILYRLRPPKPSGIPMISPLSARATACPAVVRRVGSNGCAMRVAPRMNRRCPIRHFMPESAPGRHRRACGTRAVYGNGLAAGADC